MGHVCIKIFTASLLFVVIIWFLFIRPESPIIWEYSEIARNLIEHHTFSYPHLGTNYLCFCPPLYTFLVASIYFLSNYNHMAVILAQIIIYSLLCVVVFNIGKAIFNRPTALATSILLMAHPAIIFYVLRYEHSLILDAFMIVLSTFYMLVLYDHPSSIKRAVICGIILGLTFLSRGATLILLPLFMAWIIFTFNLPIKKRLFLVFLISMVSIFTILPWTIRNYIVTKKVVLIGAASEECFWRGNNPNASGSSYDSAGRIILHDLSNKEFLGKIYASDEMEQKRIFEKAAFDFIRNNPGKFINLFAKKIFYFWWFSPQTGITYRYIYKIAYEIYYLLIVIGALFGFWLTLKVRDKILCHKICLIIGIFVAISFLQSLFYVEMRHRWAIEPLLLIFTANGLIYIKDRLKQCLKVKI